MNSNNDLMDPNWKPSFEDNRKPVVKDLEELFYSLQPLKKLLDELTELNDESLSFKIGLHSSLWLRIKKALDKLEEPS